MVRQLVNFNAIYVIESLRTDDKKTGTALYENILQRLSPKFDMLHTALHPVNSRSEFHDLMQSIYTAIFENRTVPYIHIEMHGDPEGLELGSGDVITWEELGNYFRQINIPIRNNLFVSVAACHGAYAFNCMDFGPTSQAPFFAFIGPAGKISDQEIECAFEAYFSALFRTTEINDAFDAINAAVPGKHFVMVSAEQMLDKIKQQYFDLMFQPDHDERWAQQIAVMLKCRPTYMDAPFDKLVEMARPLAKEKAMGIEMLRRHFLMLP